MDKAMTPSDHALMASKYANGELSHWNRIAGSPNDEAICAIMDAMSALSHMAAAIAMQQTEPF